MPPKKQAKLDPSVAPKDGEEVVDADADGVVDVDEPMEEVVAKEEQAETLAEEHEKDAPPDSRPKLGQSVCFLTSDTTPNIVPSCVGGMVLTLKEGGLQYLYGSVRSSVGVKSGRYAFEVKIVETLNPAEAPNSSGVRGLPKNLLRVGFSTAGSPLVLGEGENNVCFDEKGAFMHNKKRSIKKEVKYASDSSIIVVLNLDAQSSNHNTASLFIDGKRCSAPQALPDGLKGKPLFPTITFKNHTVHANFGSPPQSPLPFRCRMIEDAALEDVVVTQEKELDANEVIFPVCLPDEGTFDWLDWFLTHCPGSYTELSDRALLDWALKSGLSRQKPPSSWRNSTDKPEMNFGLGPLDDGSMKEMLANLSTMQGRNYIAMEVKANLTKEDRVANLKKWTKTGHKKVAQVMIGIPEDAYRKRTHDIMLAEKQEKANKVWEATRAKKRAAAYQKKMAEKVRKKMALAKKKEEEKKKADEAKKEGEEVKDESEVKDEKEEKGDVKEEEDEDDEKMPEDDEKPPPVTLSATEKQARFRKPLASDLSSAVLSKDFNKFSLPEDTEGFDEIRYVWSPAADCEEHLKTWVLERKLTTRIEDLTPSDWFKDKWTEWQNDFQSWSNKQIEFKDPAKRAAAGTQAAAQSAAMSKAGGPSLGASFKAPPATKPEPKQEEKPPEEKKEAEKDGKNGKEEEDEDKDPMQQLEEEMDKEDIDIFGIEDVCDMKDGQCTPLFSAFQFEDWALLSLRFELHLLVHSFRHDANDPERTGIAAEHLSYYYNKYYKKTLNPKSYGVESVEDLVELVKDVVIQGTRSKVVESQVTDDLENNEIFVKLTEESRRDRQRRIDAGQEDAKLNFSRPLATAGAKAKALGGIEISGVTGAVSSGTLGLSTPAPAGALTKSAPPNPSNDGPPSSFGIVARPSAPSNLGNFTPQPASSMNPAFGRPKGWGTGMGGAFGKGTLNMPRPAGPAAMRPGLSNLGPLRPSAGMLPPGAQTPKTGGWRPQGGGGVLGSGLGGGMGGGMGGGFGWRGNWRG